jgi:hypothetical protein
MAIANLGDISSSASGLSLHGTAGEDALGNAVPGIATGAISGAGISGNTGITQGNISTGIATSVTQGINISATVNNSF